MNFPLQKRLGIELRHFRYFIAVAEELHFGRAAAKLNIVQPALTAQIKSLEAISGIELLQRTRRRVELTDAGRVFLHESYAALERVETALQTITDLASGSTGTLRLGYGANAAIAGLISNSIRRFRSEWPNVSITFREMPGVQISEALLRNEIDVGYAAATEGLVSGVSSKDVGSWPWVLAVADTHHLARSKTVRVADISRESLAIYAEPGGRPSISGVLALMPELAPQNIYSTSHVMSLMTYVSSGLGVAFLPSPLISLNFTGVKYIEVHDNMPLMEMKVLWRSEHVSPPTLNYIRCIEPETR